MSWWMVIGATRLTWSQECLDQGSGLGQQLFLLYPAELFSILENKLYGYAYDSTLVAVEPSPSKRLAVTETLNRDLKRVSMWCDLWGMKLNANKTKTMIVYPGSLNSSPVNPINAEWNCTEGVCWPCHIGCDVG